MPKEKAQKGQMFQAERTGGNGPNPVMCKEGKGERNFTCLHYDICLEKTAKGMWSGFTCKECDYFQQREEESSC